jgi:hypothetical protein
MALRTVSVHRLKKFQRLSFVCYARKPALQPLQQVQFRCAVAGVRLGGENLQHLLPARQHLFPSRLHVGNRGFAARTELIAACECPCRARGTLLIKSAGVRSSPNQMNKPRMRWIKPDLPVFLAGARCAGAI